MGNVDNVLLLLQHGAEPEAVTKDGYTPLHIAAKEGHEEVIGVLIDQSASPNSVTKVCCIGAYSLVVYSLVVATV